MLGGCAVSRRGLLSGRPAASPLHADPDSGFPRPPLSLGSKSSGDRLTLGRSLALREPTPDSNVGIYLAEVPGSPKMGVREVS